MERVPTKTAVRPQGEPALCALGVPVQGGPATTHVLLLLHAAFHPEPIPAENVIAPFPPGPPVVSIVEDQLGGGLVAFSRDAGAELAERGSYSSQRPKSRMIFLPMARRRSGLTEPRCRFSSDLLASQITSHLTSVSQSMPSTWSRIISWANAGRAAR